MMILRHQFPQIGSVEIPLYHESKVVHELLETLKNSGTSHLERLDHLGELRQVIHCGHHSRYEFLILQLYLIHFLKQQAGIIGLSTEIEIEKDLKITSGEELLKSWAMLCENGHLLGTYEAERFVLELFVNRTKFRSQFINLIGDPEVELEAKRIIEDEDLPHFYRILSWIFIRKAEISDKAGERKNKLQLLLKNIKITL